MPAKPLHAVYETADSGNTLENMIRKQVSFDVFPEIQFSVVNR